MGEQEREQSVGLRYLRLGVQYRPATRLAFPDNPVNTLRGALGYRLRGMLCFQRARLEQGCAACHARSACVYAICFETPAAGSEAVAQGGDAWPHPLVLAAFFPPAATIAAGEEFAFGVTLLGCAVEQLPYFVQALIDVGEQGLTGARIRCESVSITDLDAPDQPLWKAGADTLQSAAARNLAIEPPPGPSSASTRVGLRFLTPVAFKDAKMGRVVNSVEFARIIRSCLRRLTAICGSEVLPRERWAFGEIIRRAEGVSIESSMLRRVTWERWSTRQRQRTVWGGMVGSVVYAGDVAAFAGLLRAGEILHVGRGTAFGQGRYQIFEPIVPARL